MLKNVKTFTLIGLMCTLLSSCDKSPTSDEIRYDLSVLTEKMFSIGDPCMREALDKYKSNAFFGNYDTDVEKIFNECYIKNQGKVLDLEFTKKLESFVVVLQKEGFSKEDAESEAKKIQTNLTKRITDVFKEGMESK